MKQKRSWNTATIFLQASGFAKISLQRCYRLDFLGVRGTKTGAPRKILSKTSNSDFFITSSSEKNRVVTKDSCFGVTPPTIVTIGLIFSAFGTSKKNRSVIRARFDFEIAGFLTGLGSGAKKIFLRILNSLPFITEV